MGEELAADDDPAPHLTARHPQDPQLYEPVIQIDEVSPRDALRKPPVIDRHARGRSQKVFSGEGDALAPFQHERLGRQLADADLGSGKVDQDGYQPARLRGQGANPPYILPVFLEAPVRKIETRHVHAAFDEALEDGL